MVDYHCTSKCINGILKFTNHSLGTTRWQNFIKQHKIQKNLVLKIKGSKLFPCLEIPCSFRIIVTKLFKILTERIRAGSDLPFMPPLGSSVIAHFPISALNFFDRFSLNTEWITKLRPWINQITWPNCCECSCNITFYFTKCLPGNLENTTENDKERLSTLSENFARNFTVNCNCR